MATSSAALPALGEKVTLLTQGAGLEPLRDWLPGAQTVTEAAALNLDSPAVIISDTPAVFSVSLRQAVLDANAASGTDNIIFDTLFNAPQTITLTSGEIAINGQLLHAFPFFLNDLQHLELFDISPPLSSSLIANACT